jgi:hypothetical protein
MSRTPRSRWSWREVSRDLGAVAQLIRLFWDIFRH